MIMITDTCYFGRARSYKTRVYKPLFISQISVLFKKGLIMVQGQ